MKSQLLLVLFCLTMAASALASGIDIKHQKKTVATLQAEPDLQDKKLSKIYVKPAPGQAFELVSFDASMPDHNHGMVVTASKPKLLADGRYEVQGVKLHMPGAWQLKFVGKMAGKEVTILQNIEVAP